MEFSCAFLCTAVGNPSTFSDCSENHLCILHINSVIKEDVFFYEAFTTTHVRMDNEVTAAVSAGLSFRETFVCTAEGGAPVSTCLFTPNWLGNFSAVQTLKWATCSIVRPWRKRGKTTNLVLSLISPDCSLACTPWTGCLCGSWFTWVYRTFIWILMILQLQPEAQWRCKN